MGNFQLMPNTEPRQIDWASAEVREGTLSVELTGSASKGWSKQFDGVLRLLEQTGGGWEEISLRKKGIEVSAVRAGSEEELRHFLESLVLQVNSDLGGELDQPPPGLRRDRDESADEELTATFRSFAGADG